MSLLRLHGWNNHFENHYAPFKMQGLDAGRVLAIQGFKYTLISIHGKIEAVLAGVLMNTRAVDDYPKVGDWVVFRRYGEDGIIIDILPRLNGTEQEAAWYGKRTPVKACKTKKPAKCDI